MEVKAKGPAHSKMRRECQHWHMQGWACIFSASILGSCKVVLGFLGFFLFRLKVKSWISNPIKHPLCIPWGKRKIEVREGVCNTTSWWDDNRRQPTETSLAPWLGAPSDQEVTKSVTQLLWLSADPHQPFVSEQTKITGMQQQPTPVGKSVLLKGSMFGWLWWQILTEKCWCVQRALWMYLVKERLEWVTVVGIKFPVSARHLCFPLFCVFP